MYAYNGLHDRLDCLRHGRALDEVSEFILTVVDDNYFCR